MLTPSIVAKNSCRFVLVCVAAYAHQVFSDAPTAVPDTRSISENTALTLNVLSNDFDADGDNIFIVSISQPANGTAVLNADGGISYLPNTDFSGEDSFTYELADDSEEGLTSQGRVTIIVQDDVYLEYADNANDESLAVVLSSVCSQLSGLSDAELGAGQRALLNQCITLDALIAASGDDISELSAALNQISPEEALAQTRIALDASRTQVKAVAQRVQQQRFARLNGQTSSIALNGRQWQREYERGAGASADESSILARLGVFASVQLEDAERDKTSLENGYDSDTTSLTVGADYFLNTSVLVGATFGLSQNEIEYANNDGDLDAELSTLSVFAAYFLDTFSFYLQGGYTWMDFDATRNVNYGVGDLTIDEVLTSSTLGNQQSLNSRVEWDWQKGVLRLTPFFRLDYVTSETDAYDELGTSGLEMSFADQSSSQLTVATGLQAAYTLTPSWGVLTPTLGLTYLSEADSDRDDIEAGFAVDPDSSRAYVLSNDGGDSAYYQLSLGASAVFVHGISAFAEYTEFLGYENWTASQFQLGVRYEL